MTTWRFTDDQGIERELSTADLRAALSSGSLLPSTLVWREGMKEWAPAFTLGELATAAIAAARGTRTPTVPPGGLTAAEAAKNMRGPLKTLLGIEAPLIPDADPRKRGTRDGADASPIAPIVVPSGDPDARTSPQTQPQTLSGGPELDLGAIPPAPRLPRETAPPGEVPPATLGLLPNGSPARPKSVPPPLPGSSRSTDRLPKLIPSSSFQKSTSQRRPTLMGMNAPSADDKTTTHASAPVAAGRPGSIPNIRSRPPPHPPPKRSKPPPPMGAVEPTPPPALAKTGETALVRPKPPVPPRKQSIPPATDPNAIVSPQTTAVLEAVKEAAKEPGLPNTTAVLDAVGSQPAAQRTMQMAAIKDPPAAKAGPVVPKPPSPPLKKPLVPAAPTAAEVAARRPSDPAEKIDAKPSSKNADAKADDGKSVETGKSEGDSSKSTPPKKGDMAGLADETTEQMTRPPLLGAKALLATLGEGDDEDSNTLTFTRKKEDADKDPPEEGEPSSRRQKTLEMSLGDHANASESEPVPASEKAKRKEAKAAAKTASTKPASDEAKASNPPAKSTTTVSSRPPASSSSERPSASSSRPDRKHPESIQVPRRSIVGASLLWMVGLVTFFFVGRYSGVRRATEIDDAREGFGRAFLLRTMPMLRGSGGGVSSEPKPCWVSRQPSRWAKRASKNIPFDMEASGTSIALGYAVNDKEAVGILIDPKTGKFDEKLRKHADDAIARVSPDATGENGFFIEPKGDKERLVVGGEKPFFLTFDKTSVGQSDTAEAAPTELFHLTGDDEVNAPQATLAGTDWFLSFRQGTQVYGGYMGADRSVKGALATIAGSGGKGGKPKSAFNGDEVAVAFADMPEDSKEWQIRIGHAKSGTVPDTTAVFPLPGGGPGGDRIAPDIVGLDDGRWLLMWTEGPAGERAIRAITLSHDFEPIGDPIALSPPAGNFGQAVLGVVGSYTTVVFLQRGEEDYEMWGAVLQCG